MGHACSTWRAQGQVVKSGEEESNLLYTATYHTPGSLVFTYRFINLDGRDEGVQCALSCPFPRRACGPE